MILNSLSLRKSIYCKFFVNHFVNQMPRSESGVTMMKDIWFARPGLEKLLSYQLTTDERCTCNVKPTRIESSSDHAIETDSPFAYQRMPHYQEFRNKDTETLVNTIHKVVSTALLELSPTAMWDFHALRSEGESHQDAVLELQRAVLRLFHKRTPMLLKNKMRNGRVLNRHGDLLVQLFMRRKDTACVSIATMKVAPGGWWSLPLPWPFGHAHVEKEKQVPAQSYLKLKEIFMHFRLDPATLQGRLCVELGAAPGGWTHVLVQNGCIVHSIDWAPLSPSLSSHPNVTHHKGDAKEWQLPVGGAPLFLLTCDLSMPPPLSLELLSDWLQQALSEKIIWTIKFSYHSSPNAKNEETKRYEVLRMVKDKIDEHKTYHYTIRTIYNHGEEMVILASRLPKQSVTTDE